MYVCMYVGATEPCCGHEMPGWLKFGAGESLAMISRTMIPNETFQHLPETPSDYSATIAKALA